MTINIYDRELTIEQVSGFLPNLEDDILKDLAHSINNNNSKEDIKNILRELYIMNPDCNGLAKLYKIFNVTPNDIVGNKKSKKGKKVKKSKRNHEHDFDAGLQHVENFEPSKSPTILPGVAYETSREKRKLGEITDVPSVDFEMPTVPDLPTLD